MNPDSLSKELTPPRGLEERTVAALRRDGLLRRRRGVWLLPAAAVVLFAAGVSIGRVSAAPVDLAPGKPRFLLLLQGPITATEPEATLVEEYRAWARRLSSDGRFVTGERLGDSATIVPPDGSSPLRDLQGYFLISADDVDDARNVAASCPHISRGGRVVVRPIDPT